MDAYDDIAPVAEANTPIKHPAWAYGFFQLIRLLADMNPNAPLPGTTFSYRDEAIRIRPDAVQVFPPGDVKSLREAHDGNPAEVTVTFGGLYGIDGALPASFHEHFARREDESAPIRAFLDVFNHRMYTYLWRAWARNQPDLLSEDTTVHKTFAARLESLAGLNTPGVTDPPVSTQRLLPFAGILSAWSRNAQGLQILIVTLLDLPVEVRENVPRTVFLDERPKVGFARLGYDTVVGEKVVDASGKFQLVIGPLSLDTFLNLLPGRPGAKQLDALIRLYAPDYLDYDVDLRVRAAELPRLRLGDRSCTWLGLTTCLGTSGAQVLGRKVRYSPS